MARFKTEGLEELIDELQRHKEALDEAAPEMLRAGADVIADAWRDAIKKHRLIDTGEMLSSVSASYIITADTKKATIYPAGKDSKGIRNAEKAFVNHYGASNKDATHFVDDAKEQAEEAVTDAIEAVLFGVLNSEG